MIVYVFYIARVSWGFHRIRRRNTQCLTALPEKLSFPVGGTQSHLFLSTPVVSCLGVRKIVSWAKVVSKSKQAVSTEMEEKLI